MAGWLIRWMTGLVTGWVSECVAGWRGQPRHGQTKPGQTRHGPGMTRPDARRVQHQFIFPTVWVSRGHHLKKSKTSLGALISCVSCALISWNKEHPGINVLSRDIQWGPRRTQSQISSQKSSWKPVKVLFSFCHHTFNEKSD